MGTYSGPPSAADGLVFHIDPANPRSYSGSGITIFDLVTGGIGATLTNSPTYDVASKGGIIFDGINDYAVCGRREDIQSENITLSIWAKFYSLTSGDVAVCFGWTDGVNWRQGNGIGSYAGLIRSFLTSVFYTGNLNSWYHIALTSNQSTNNLYINGIGVSSSSASLVYASSNLLVMGWGGSGYGSYAKFTLGSAKIHNRGLSAAEVAQEYNATKKRYYPEENIVTDGLVLHLDAANSSSYIGSGTSSNSLVGGIAGTLVNGTGFSAVGGGAFFFDGTNDYINLGNSSVLKPTVLSVGCYFKINTIGAVHVIVGKQGPGAGAASYALVVQSGKLHFRICNSSGTEYNASSDFSDTTNYNYALGTYDGSTLRLYLNGASIASSTVGISIGYSDSYPLKVGYYGDAIPVNMNVSVLNIYNRVLSATEVQQNYNALRGRYNI